MCLDSETVSCVGSSATDTLSDEDHVIKNEHCLM